MKCNVTMEYVQYVPKGVFLLSRQTYDIKVEFNFNEFILLNTYLKLSCSTYVFLTILLNFNFFIAKIVSLICFRFCFYNN